MRSERRSSSVKNIARSQVAYLASEGLTQKKIASLLGLSQSTVSVLLQEASTRGEDGELLLDIRPRFLGSAEQREQVQNSLFIGELQRLLDDLGEILKWDFVPKVYVGLTEPESLNWDRKVKAWGKSVAPQLVELLSPCKTIAVAWGRQLRGMVEGISSLQIERNSKAQTLVFACWPPRLSVRPESDDSIFKDHVAIGSNSLAFDLSVALNGESSRNIVARNFLPGIDMVPFTDPPFLLETNLQSAKNRELLEKERQAVIDFKSILFEIPAYQRIFGGFLERTEDCLLRNADAAIFPSGPPGGRRSFAMGDTYGGIPLEWFAKHTHGDIGGVIIPAQELETMSPAVRLQFERLRNHWMGTWEEDLAHIARKGKVGTIVGAVGDDRIKPILYGCRKQLIRHLFCDPTLAAGLSREIVVLIEKLRGKKTAR